MGVLLTFWQTHWLLHHHAKKRAKKEKLPVSVFFRPPIQFPVWRSDKQRKTAIICLIIFGLCDTSQLGLPLLYSLDHLPPLICLVAHVKPSAGPFRKYTLYYSHASHLWFVICGEKNGPVRKSMSAQFETRFDPTPAYWISIAYKSENQKEG